MKLLIVTQTLDNQDPILGFFVRWVEEFAKNCEEVHVLALNVGTYELPENVKIHCLGKSEGQPKIVWLWRLWRHSFTLRHHYNAVFVHMNPEYVLYGVLVWQILSKQIGLWYAHGTVSQKLKIAHFFSDFIFTSTEKGFRINSPKRNIVGQGIDTNVFSYKEHTEVTPFLNLVTVGRIAPSKKIETLLAAALRLKETGVEFKLSMYGQPQNSEEQKYKEKLHVYVEKNKLSQVVSFEGPLLQKQIPAVLHQATIFIQDGQTGSLDKVLLEGVSCGIITISSNEAYGDFVDMYKSKLVYPTGNAEVLVDRILAIKDYPKDASTMKKFLRKKVEQNHSIENLIKKILKSYVRNTDS